ncbi:transcription factor bHLH94-like [Phragmites australis]|uniref:transcription factor bHLH94-like n=1 Tax=Phragmites australis TaxID=29695 RepID=UPI002D79F2E8|nr:transcription factor bHLH94-like [Phragmites australis]
MALEAVVFPQEHLACAAKAAVASLGCDIDIDELEDKGGIVLQEETDALPPGAGAATTWDAPLCPCSIAPGALEECWEAQHRSMSPPPVPPALAPGRGKAAAAASRRRRRRPKVVKNKEEMESQRRNHIAVERNRRRQMNEYLAVLRSVMPPSYAQRGDQASIVAGAINFVKELEQLLQSLEAQKRSTQRSEPPAVPFAGFFTFPQYSAGATGVAGAGDSASSGGYQSGGCAVLRGAADIEVAVAESHANVKVLAPRRPRQLLRIVVALQCLGLTVLHLNVTTTADHLAFYSFSLKMEDQCRLSSADDVAAAVNEIVAKISDECVSQLANYLKN